MSRLPAVVGLGESLLRLSAPAHGRLQHVESLEVHVGGAEMNTLIGVAALGGQATLVTRLADNPLGRRISNHAVAYGVEVVVDWDTEARAPLYFVEHGLPPRPSEVFYDRSNTAMTRLHPSQFSWPELVTDKDVAFTTGITCSLGNEPMRAVQAFFGAARNRGCRTAFDLNYRSRLWSWKQATSSLRTLLESVSVLFAGADDLSHLFEVDGGDPLLLARKVVTDLGPEIVVLRETSTLRDRAVRVTVTAVTKTDVVISQVHEAYAFDAFGAGDAATAAFLVMWLAQTGLEVACDAAAWACAFQHTIPGDAWQGRISDLEGRHEILRRILR